MKHIAMATFHDEAYKPIADITTPHKREYCKRHGYDFIYHDKKLTNEFDARCSAWNKIVAIQNALAKGYQWVFWTDVDAAIIRPEIKLEQFTDEDRDFVFGCDSTGLNTGNFLIQNTLNSHRFLQIVREWPEEKVDPISYEQQVFRHMIKRDWHIFRFNLLGDFVNAMPSQCGGKFIVHCQGMDLEARKETLAWYCGLREHNAFEWISSWFGNNIGRCLDIECESSLPSPCFGLTRLGWDAYFVPKYPSCEPILVDENRAFNVVSVSMNTPPTDMVFDYAHFMAPTADGMKRWLPWLSRCQIVSCSSDSIKIMREHGFRREVHRTKSIAFMQ